MGVTHDDVAHTASPYAKKLAITIAAKNTKIEQSSDKAIILKKLSCKLFISHRLVYCLILCKSDIPQESASFLPMKISSHLF